MPAPSPAFRRFIFGATLSNISPDAGDGWGWLVLG
jgi:hypothetical protein